MVYTYKYLFFLLFFCFVFFNKYKNLSVEDSFEFILTRNHQFYRGLLIRVEHRNVCVSSPFGGRCSSCESVGITVSGTSDVIQVQIRLEVPSSVRTLFLLYVRCPVEVGEVG